MTPTVALGRWIAETPAVWPEEATRLAADAFLDTVACMLAGAGDEAVRRVRGVAAGWSQGPVAVPGIEGGFTAPHAALVGGTAAHALDFDDVLVPALAHVSAVLVPALLALGQERGAGGAALIDAYIAGIEVQARLAEAVNMDHYRRGWHTTSTLGAPAAAAACARLLGLGRAEAGAAISLSTSLAGGSKRQFGTMAKPLHAGLAAHNGVLAAAFAAAGVTAAEEALDGPWGLRELMAGPDAPGFAADFDRPRDRPALVEHGLWMKPYPCCASTHRAIDGVLTLRRDHGITPEAVRRIDVLVSEIAVRNLMYAAPATEMEARFSMNHCIAAALADGAVTLDAFTPAALRRDDLCRLWPRVEMGIDPELTAQASAREFRERARMAVELADGRTLRATVEVPKGFPSMPLTPAELAGKFRGCAAGVLKAEAVEAAIDGFAGIAARPRVADLIRLLKPTVSAQERNAFDVHRDRQEA